MRSVGKTTVGRATTLPAAMVYHRTERDKDGVARMGRLEAMAIITGAAEHFDERSSDQRCCGRAGPRRRSMAASLKDNRS